MGKVDWLVRLDWLREQIASGRKDEDIAAELRCAKTEVQNIRGAFNIYYSGRQRSAVISHLNLTSKRYPETLAQVNKYAESRNISGAAAMVALVDYAIRNINV